MRSRAFLIPLVLILMGPYPGWSGESSHDSAALHVLAGAAAALWISAVAHPLVDVGSQRKNAAVVAAAGVAGALLAGMGKELLDLGGWGQPQWADLLLTVGGGLLAGTVVYAVTTGFPGSEPGNRGISAAYGAFALILSLPVGENLLRRTKPS